MTQPLNICFLKRSFAAKGGLEKHAIKILNYFLDLGHEITAISEDGLNSQDKIHQVQTKTHSGFSFRKVSGFNTETKKLLLKTSFDLVFGFDRTENQTHMRLGNGVHRAYLEQRKQFDPWYKKIFHFNPLDKTILKIEKESFLCPDLKVILANSHMVKNQVLKYYPVDPKLIHVLHNGVEWETLQLAFDKTFEVPICPPFSYNPSVVQLLFIGHGFARKGLPQLLQTLSLLSKEDFHLHVVGHDKKLCYFRQMAQFYGLADKVTFHGKALHPHLFYQIADCVVVPSFYDPFANVTVEALAMGNFVVTSRSNGGHEIITPNTGKILDDLLDITTFANTIKSVLTKKTKRTAQIIRDEVKHLDFKNQLSALVDICLRPYAPH
jgi:UDP-glucose:(heptosyl)LPS alpha-1,3-glucosyltransferase